MIKYIDGVFSINTKNTSYVFRVMETGHLEHIYYGTSIDVTDDFMRACSEKSRYPAGNLISYSQDNMNITLENRCLEVSSYGKGDVRDPFIIIKNVDGSYTSDFIYKSYEICNGHIPLKGLPSAYSEDMSEDSVMQLKVILQSNERSVRLELVYTAFDKCDCITRSARVVNEEKHNIYIDRIMSCQLDYCDSDYDFINFTGAWAREMHMNRNNCVEGKLINSSIAGTSSNRNNPFVMVAAKDAGESSGECYGFNLIYSGNHYECAQVDSFGKMRIQVGINPDMFGFELPPGFDFQAPEMVMSYSNSGFNGLSHNMHTFVRNNIVRGTWKNTPRPILINSWETAYFKFNESKLLKLANAAADVGIELFVLDDGWFGKRDDDKHSLGDWYCNRTKLPDGIDGLARKINKIGMDFGIWVEPEMVNVDSDCYRTHPDWTVEIFGKNHSEGRNQRILNLTLSEVRKYVIDSMDEVFSSANIKYVKWDMNRIFSDMYSKELSNQKEFFHRYILGLYEILDVLMKKYPDILFEGCASGGNRFDLGMLCYFPQIWASDNTDAWCRAQIQNCYSYGYPISVISSHISDSPNHQTLRKTLLETRFDVAVYGNMGYECNICDLSSEEKSEVSEQISFYKKYRNKIFDSDYYRVKSGQADRYKSRWYEWSCISKDKSFALISQMRDIAVPNLPLAQIKTIGLKDEAMYHFYNRQIKYNIKLFGSLVNAVSPVHIKTESTVQHCLSKFVKMDGETEEYRLTGRTLNNCGIKLKQNYSGTGFDSDVRYFQDFGSRLYIVEEEIQN